MFLVHSEHRGRVYGRKLWQHALQHLEALTCIGIEAAPNRINDYTGWGFVPASATQRWQLISDGSIPPGPNPDGLRLLAEIAVPDRAVHPYDAQRKLSPRPHCFDRLDASCHGFGRIRPCLPTCRSGVDRCPCL